MQSQQQGTHAQNGLYAGQSLGMSLRDRDLFVNTLLVLKHAASEYTTAVTEAGCPVVRQTLQRLLHETLTEQADCYQVMSRQGWYPPGPAPTRQDIRKVIQNARQTASDMAQSIQAAGMPGGAQRPAYAQGAGWTAPAGSGYAAQGQGPSGWQSQNVPGQPGGGTWQSAPETWQNQALSWNNQSGSWQNPSNSWQGSGQAWSEPSAGSSQTPTAWQNSWQDASPTTGQGYYASQAAGQMSTHSTPLPGTTGGAATGGTSSAAAGAAYNGKRPVADRLTSRHSNGEYS